MDQVASRHTSVPHAVDLPSTDFRLVWADSASELGPWVEAWDRLAATCLESNVFFEAATLLPALEQLASPRVSVALIVAKPRQNASGGDVLCGLFPIVTKRGRMEIWQHPYAFQGTPLIRSEVAADVCAFFLREAVTGAGARARVIRCANLRGAGPAARLLIDAARRAGCGTWVQSQRFRAEFRPAASSEAFALESIKRKVRRNLGRERKLLESRGELTTTTERIQPGNVDKWSEEFMSVEASGWKGRQGTALSASDRDEAWFRTMMRSKSEEGRLLGASLRLDRQPLAMGVMLEAAPSCASPEREAAYLKIAFVESHADVSLGGLLQLAWLDMLHGESGLESADSCAIPGHPLIERFWPGRVMMQTTWIARDTYVDRLRLWLFQGAYGLKEARRSRSKSS